MEDVKRQGVKEYQRWYKTVKEKPKLKLIKPDIMVKVKVIEYPDSKYYIK